MKDYTIEITYAVYQKGHGVSSDRLIGKYPCKCVAWDVVKYLDFNYGVECYVTKSVKEI